MQLQHLLSATRRAVQDYDMIQAGDTIAIGISGGKDSLVLALALSHLRRFYPKPFNIIGITVSLGFDNFDFGGDGRIHHNCYTAQEQDGKWSIRLYLPSRTAVALKKVN